MDIRRYFLYSLIASVAASAVIGIIVILFGEFGDFETKVLLTTTTITVTSILGLACGAFLETGRGRYMPIAGIGLAGISAVMWLIMIWQGDIRNDIFVKSLMSATLLAAACSHLSLLSLARLDRRFAWSIYAAHAAGWSLTAFLLYLIWTNGNVDEEIIGRVTGVLGIILGALTVVTPVFHKLSSTKKSLAEVDAEIAGLRTRIAELEKQKAELSQEP